MSPRDRFPKPREYPAHYSISFGRGERVRTFGSPKRARRPSLHRSAARARLPRADAALHFPRRSSRLADVAPGRDAIRYEDRLAAMRTQIEQMKSRELVQEQAYSGRLHELFQRQTQLETRATLVASLAQRAGMAGDVTGEIPRPSSTKAETPSHTGNGTEEPAACSIRRGRFASRAAAAFAPITTTQPFQTLKPHLDAMEL